jgi:hypothetical protein
MKRQRKKEGMVRVGGDWSYPVEKLRGPFEAVKTACHEHGLQFLCAENRLRLEMTDSVSCCGAGDLVNFGRTNTANLNHIQPDGTILYTIGQKKKGTAECWKGIAQTTLGARAARAMSYEEAMNLTAKTKVFREVMGLPGGKEAK